MTDVVEGPARAAAQRGRGSRPRPDLETLYCINPDGSHRAIHPADVRGRFQRLKKTIWAILVLVYVALPWINVGGRPAILIDIPGRHFFLFGATFSAKDFWLAFFFLAGIGVLLVLLSALYGRVWCGYACPQTVFLEGFYRRIERWIEGSASQRERLARAPWTGRKLAKKAVKHALYCTLSLLLAHVFLSYFIPVRELGDVVTSSPSEHMTAFLFVMGLTAVMWFNFGWFREQLCLIVCPYGRLQSILYDPDTIVVGYDARRGEPRGRWHVEGRGDCIDCYRCVAVCPTGIDIRNGHQLECIGCANCIDACDEVMERVGQPKGLIRNDSLNAFLGRPRRFWRPRVAVYAGILVLVAGGFAAAASTVVPLEARLLRLVGPAYQLRDGVIYNNFRIHLLNKQKAPVRVHLAAEGPQAAKVSFHPAASFDLPVLEDRNVIVTVALARARYEPGRTRVRIRLTAGEDVRVLEGPFLGPDR